MGTVPSPQAAPEPPAVLPTTHQRNFLWSTIYIKRGAMAVFDCFAHVIRQKFSFLWTPFV